MAISLPTANDQGLSLGHAAHSAIGLETMHATVSICIVCVALLYTVGAFRLNNRRSVSGGSALLRPLSMFVGLGVLAGLLATPLDTLAHRLVSVHMAQHMGVMLLAAPLLIWGQPLKMLSGAFSTTATTLREGTSMFSRLKTVAALLYRPETAWCAFCFTVIFWHLPSPYFSAHADVALHALMQASFLVAALLFWSVILEEGNRRLGVGPTIPFVLSATLVASMPGALLSFAHRPLLETPNSVLPLGLTWLEDQQLAGLTMWIPMDIILFAVSAFLFAVWVSPPAAWSGRGR